MKAIVHIGAPKTGTSTIQEFLFRNAAGLAAQGFRFHRNVPGRLSQYEYPLAALSSIDRLLPWLEDQIRYSSTDMATHKATGTAIIDALARNRATWNEPVALFSSEHIHPWLIAPEEIRAFDSLFAQYFDEIRYVLYIRNQEDLILSLYSQAIKNGANWRLQGYVSHFLKTLDWEPRIRTWVSVVGRERFDLRLFDQSFLVGGDLVSDFASACGFSLDGLEVLPPINESLSAAAAECLRMLNERIPDQLHDGSLNPLRLGLVNQVMALSPKGAPTLALSPEQRAQILAVVAEPNERLRADFFPTRETLFPDARDRQAPGRGQILEEALDLLTQLFIRSRLGQIPALKPDEIAGSVQRPRGGFSSGVTLQPKPGK